MITYEIRVEDGYFSIYKGYKFLGIKVFMDFFEAWSNKDQCLLRVIELTEKQCIK